jgi:4-methylaminobutanoate oxidase (formaldehyde-forming)
MPVELAEPGTTVAIDIFGNWIDGEVRADPLYDPKGERIRA